MTEPAVRQRTAYWDNAKGFLIVMVVLGHYLYGYKDVYAVGFLVSMIYAFHMPAFVLISGYFSRGERSSSARSIARLTAAYLIFNTLMMIYKVVADGAPLSLTEPYNSYWYLLALIVWRLTIKYLSKIRGLLAISVIVALLIGFWGDVSNEFALSRIICFFPFFLAGYKMSEEKAATFIKNRTLSDYLKGILLLIVSVGLTFNFILFFSPPIDVFLMGGYYSPDQLLSRLIVFVLAGMIITGLAFVIPSKPVALLSVWGRNSLAIYVLHRPFSLMFVTLFPEEGFSNLYLLWALIASAVTLAVFGLAPVSQVIHLILDRIADIVCDTTGKITASRKELFRIAVVLVLIMILTLPVILNFFREEEPVVQAPLTGGYAIMSDRQASDIQNAVSIAFVGDLILLQDQVRNARIGQTDGYDFSPVFAYAKQYLSEADLAFGVFEGPMAGAQSGYSTGNYDDGLPVALNYPDSFAYAVKEAGIDFVTTANNHLLDKGIDGAMRTLDVLDQAGLGHTGSYRDVQEKSAVQILSVQGLKIGVLSYTYAINGYEPESIAAGNPDITSLLVDPADPSYENVKQGVLDDFARVRASSPDVIMVLPHMGTQFLHATDNYQDVWNDVFIEAGADLVLGDHSHAVQPIEFRTAAAGDGSSRQALIVNCAGNFANSYTAQDGDATAITEVYLDPSSGDVICAAVIPMYTQSPVNGNYRALPIYDILTDEDLQGQISTYEFERVAAVQSIVTSVLLGADISIDEARERYYLFPSGYVREPVAAMAVTPAMTRTALYKLLKASGSVCFVGDSLTAGSENGGYGWYEPLMANFPGTAVIREAWPGAATGTLLENALVIAAHGADTYVIAVGTNDVRYRNPDICAMDEAAYITNLSSLAGQILDINPDANLVFICPWPALDNDPFTAIPMVERDALLASYGLALKSYCEDKGYLYLDPTPAIRRLLSVEVTSDYLIDHIHPNSGKGIDLFSRAVLES